jgi:hypothetical protein
MHGNKGQDRNNNAFPRIKPVLAETGIRGRPIKSGMTKQRFILAGKTRWKEVSGARV